MARIISCVNLKGGVGKTAIAVNFAAYSGMQGKKTLLVDVDPQTNATFSCIEPEKWGEVSKKNGTVANLLGMRNFSAEGSAPSAKDVIVRQNVDDTKTLSSESLLPLPPDIIRGLKRWQRQAQFTAPEDFVFASPFQDGKLPYNPEGLQRERIAPAGRAINFPDTLGWHNLRHTYRTLLDKLKTPLSVQQALMRHADPRQTLEYGEGLSPDQRNANAAVVRLILKRRAAKRTQNGRGKSGR